MKNPISSTKKFVADHKVAIAITLTAAATAAAMNKLTTGALDSHLDYLVEKGLGNDYLSWLGQNL